MKPQEIYYKASYSLQTNMTYFHIFSTFAQQILRYCLQKELTRQLNLDAYQLKQFLLIKKKRETIMMFIIKCNSLIFNTLRVTFFFFKPDVLGILLL